MPIGPDRSEGGRHADIVELTQMVHICTPKLITLGRGGFHEAIGQLYPHGHAMLRARVGTATLLAE